MMRRASQGALKEAMEELRRAQRVSAAAAGNASAAVVARESFSPALQAEALAEQSLVAHEEAEKAAHESAEVAAAVEIAGLRVVPLPERVATAWGHGVWGGALDDSAAGGLLKLTDALPNRTGWALWRPSTPLASWNVELDLWVGGGTGGDGFSLSCAPIFPTNASKSAPKPYSAAQSQAQPQLDEHSRKHHHSHPLPRRPSRTPGTLQSTSRRSASTATGEARRPPQRVTASAQASNTAPCGRRTRGAAFRLRCAPRHDTSLSCGSTVCCWREA